MEKGSGKGWDERVESLVEPGKLYKGQGIQGGGSLSRTRVKSIWSKLIKVNINPGGN